ncbi:MAG: class I SAM-dependent methyltransferase [Bryobacteraceae bacterium]|nr:class I SAM-dependent methyltransferase [Bryobacteraceae bacterium]
MSEYDTIAYPGYPFAQTHPDRLGAIARLHGLEPAPPAGSRVLEIACGDGSNLIPMAYGMPGARFLGIDYAAQPVETGRRAAAELGLGNIELCRADILEFEDEGPFDYILAHGLYSWVPAAVQERTLEICRRSLAPHGVAFISYDTLPGGYERQVVRDLMAFHATSGEPEQRLRDAKEILAFAAKEANPQRSYGQGLMTEWKRLEGRDAGFVYHDHLAPQHEALYLTEFVRRAQKAGLAYLGEADYSEMSSSFLSPEAAARVEDFARGDRIRREQYLDYLKGRQFRQTLLVRAERQIEEARPERIAEMLVTSPAREEEPGVFRRGQGRLRSQHPLTRVMMQQLGRAWPAAVRACDLASTESDRKIVYELLLVCFERGFVDLHIWQPSFTRQPSAQPVASAVARREAAMRRRLVGNLWHALVEVEEAARELLLKLDGSYAPAPDDPLVARLARQALLIQ